MLLLPGAWGSMLLSIVFYLFFWRVDNEPGVLDMPGLLWTAVSLCSIGGLAFLGGHILLIKKSVVAVRYWLGIVHCSTHWHHCPSTDFITS